MSDHFLKLMMDNPDDGTIQDYKQKSCQFMRIEQIDQSLGFINTLDAWNIDIVESFSTAVTLKRNFE